MRGPGEVRGVVGGLQQRAGKQEVAAVAVRASGTRRASDWREEEDLPAPGGLVRLDGLPGKAQVLLSFSLISLSYF